MRKLITAALAGATFAGGFAVAGTANAQYYDRYGNYHRSYADEYYRVPPPAQDPYYYGRRGGSADALSVLGSVLGLDDGYMARVPVDRYGPNPHGLIAPDGHRIRCKLRSGYDSYYRGYVKQRTCR